MRNIKPSSNVVSLPRVDDKARREINSLRFSWHEKLLADTDVRRFPNALVFAAYIMHRFNPDRGYAEVSLGELERKLNMPKCSAIRARNGLLRRGWLIIREKYKPSLRWSATRYALGGGPEDLDLTLHGVADEHTGVGAPIASGEDCKRYE